MKKDKNGYATDCNFYKDLSRRPVCTALVDFYNCTDPTDQCGDCPFFKTRAEFFKGWKNRGGIYDTI